MYSNPSHPNEYKDWQLRAPTVDEGQAKLPSSLKGLLRHIRNVWEHRAEKAHTITGAPQLPPSMAQVMNYFEDHFPFVVDDAWKVAQCTVAFPLLEKLMARMRHRARGIGVGRCCETRGLYHRNGLVERHVLELWSTRPVNLLLPRIDETYCATLVLSRSTTKPSEEPVAAV